MAALRGGVQVVMPEGREPVALERAAQSLFGELLRKHRLAAGLTQEALAERARMSAEGIGALERGHRQAPYRATVALLAQALALPAATAAELEASAARPPRPRSGRRGRPLDERVSHNLPLQTTRFLGRRRERAELGALLDERRVVTLTGTGGIGKTRLALEAAAGRVERCADGVWFVNLAPLSDPALVPGAVAGALGIRLGADGPAGAQLLGALRGRQALILLDNCEHVIAAAAELADGIARDCPSVTLLVTSREPLRVAGERVFRLPSLEVPPPDFDLAANDPTAYAAIELFADRARAGDAAFTLSAMNAPLVAAIVRRLDGIPLAIELAAARVHSLGLQAVAQRLDERFRLLTDGSRSALPRHQTLRAAFDWGHELLPEIERALFARLAIFAGGWTLEAAEAVCRGAGLDGDIIAILAALVDKSLVVAETDAERVDMRYRLLESTRAYAAEKLAGRGESALLGRRHALWAGELAERAGEASWARSMRDWLTDVEPEAANIRAALTWAAGAAEPLLAARITAPILGYWLERSQAEGRGWVDWALARLDSAEHPALYAELLIASAFLNDGERSRDDAARAVAILDERAERRTAARAWYLLAAGELQVGRFEAAANAVERAALRYIAAGLDRTRWFAHALSLGGAIARCRDRLAEAGASCEAALALCESLGDEVETARARMNLADIKFSAGDARRALELVMQVRAVGGLTSFVEGPALVYSAVYLIALGDPAAAHSAAVSALMIARRTHNAFLAVNAIVHLTEILALRNDLRRAARLKGVVDAWATAAGCAWEGPERASQTRVTALLQSRVAPGELAALIAAGGRLDVAAAIDEALAPMV